MNAYVVPQAGGSQELDDKSLKVECRLEQVQEIAEETVKRGVLESRQAYRSVIAPHRLEVVETGGLDVSEMMKDAISQLQMLALTAGDPVQATHCQEALKLCEYIRAMNMQWDGVSVASQSEVEQIWAKEMQNSAQPKDFVRMTEAASVHEEGTHRLVIDRKRHVDIEHGTADDPLLAVGRTRRLDRIIRLHERLFYALHELKKLHPDAEKLHRDNQRRLAVLLLSQQHTAYVDRADAEIVAVNSVDDILEANPHGDGWINPYQRELPVITYYVELNSAAEYKRKIDVLTGLRIFSDAQSHENAARKNGKWLNPKVSHAKPMRHELFHGGKMTQAIAALPVAKPGQLNTIAHNDASAYLSKALILTPQQIEANFAELTDADFAEAEVGMSREQFDSLATFDDKLQVLPRSLKVKVGAACYIELSAISELVADPETGFVHAKNGRIYSGSSDAGAIQAQTSSVIPKKDAQGNVLRDPNGVMQTDVLQSRVSESDAFILQRYAASDELPFGPSPKFRRMFLDLKPTIMLLHQSKRKDSRGEFARRIQLSERQLQASLQRALAEISRITLDIGPLTAEQYSEAVFAEYETLQKELEELRKG